jgi:hypothetical protein
MKRGFYILTTIFLFCLVVLIFLFKANLALSLEDYVNEISPGRVDQSLVDGGPNIDLSQSIEENTRNSDGNVDILFTVHDDELIRSCTLYDDINQPFGPDKKQINTFVQLDYPVTFNLESLDNGEYQWGIVCEDRLFRSNPPIRHTFIVKKLPPSSLDIPDVEIAEDGVFVLDLNSYFSDSKDPNLRYKSLIDSVDIKVNIDPATGLALIEPQKNWFGELDLKFVASNKFGLETESNQIHVVVLELGDTPPRFRSLNAIGSINNTLDEDGYLFLECNVTDDYAIKEVSFYSDISGEWKLEETKNVDSIDSSVTFNVKNVSNGNYSWGCSAKDNNGNETFSEKQPIEVSIDISLEHTIPQFMVNNVDTDRSFFVSFSSYLNDSLRLGKLVIRKSNGQIYYQQDMSSVQHGIINAFGSSKIEYYDNVEIIPGKIFDNNFVVGNKAQLDISLEYTYNGVLYRKEVTQEIEITSKVRSEVGKHG